MIRWPAGGHSIQDLQDQLKSSYLDSVKTYKKKSLYKRIAVSKAKIRLVWNVFAYKVVIKYEIVESAGGGRSVAYWPCRLNFFVRCTKRHLKGNFLKISA